MLRDDTNGDALRYLAQYGQSPSKHVARAVGWGSRTAGAKMAGLEKQGLVARVRVKESTFASDARYEWVLTAKGFELCPRRFDEPQDGSGELGAAGDELVRVLEMAYDVCRQPEQCVMDGRANGRCWCRLTRSAIEKWESLR